MLRPTNLCHSLVYFLGTLSSLSAAVTAYTHTHTTHLPIHQHMPCLFLCLSPPQNGAGQSSYCVPGRINYWFSPQHYQCCSDNKTAKKHSHTWAYTHMHRPRFFFSVEDALFRRRQSPTGKNTSQILKSCCNKHRTHSQTMMHTNNQICKANWIKSSDNHITHALVETMSRVFMYHMFMHYF